MTTLDIYIFSPLREMVSTVISFVPTIVSVFLILVLGHLLAKVLRELLNKLFKEIRLDKVSDNMELSKVLHAGSVKHSLSHVLSAVVYMIVAFMVLILTMNVLDIGTIPGVIAMQVAYVGQVLTAMFMLVMGLVLGKVIGKVVHLIAGMFDLPDGKLMERVSRWAIVLYAAKMALSELGFGFLLSGTVFHIWFGGLVLALALAYGLGGRDGLTKLLSRK